MEFMFRGSILRKRIVWEERFVAAVRELCSCLECIGL